ncbi:phage major tail protein, TP901-1 family [Clostridium perfringens]|uniref:phage major tail protein, TP901-1 family n=1 Tax=Clostridium perfringens TaxID=1502 RepID=UPI0029791E14|nr:phage major tail protein, TP901-1 family [Clostridium perfringens]MDK0834980.1 phage major tail protein, TP901-1 family [Clostridium perfringens]MDK0928475.1 phage major tail protein, TP901-1 family [Clostridium perfringens]MDM0495300.1 phage major tail protein, TP901-1 family [Clostridium perfringens]MDM0781016.1 phage major tail protein, TP901-1 family [Clostridium perfringens]
MAGKKVAGVDVLLKIKKNESFIAVGGQKGATLNRSAETIDVSDKTSGGWKESIMGLKEWSLDCDGFVTLGDEGLGLIHDAFDNRTAIEIEVAVGGTGGYTYTGSVVITDFPEEYPSDDAVTFSLSLQGASPLVRKPIS